MHLIVNSFIDCQSDKFGVEFVKAFVEKAQNWFFAQIAQSTIKYKSVLYILYINPNEKYFLKLQYLKKIKSYHVNSYQCQLSYQVRKFIANLWWGSMTKTMADEKSLLQLLWVEWPIKSKVSKHMSFNRFLQGGILPPHSHWKLSFICPKTSDCLSFIAT